MVLLSSESSSLSRQSRISSNFCFGFVSPQILNFFYFRDNPALAPLLSSLGSVSLAGSPSAEFSSSVSLASLLPKDTSAFYRYSGSLTTPGCNEVVTWTLLHHPVGVSEFQLAGLRALLDGDGNTMGDNFRAVQPLYGRKVTANGLGSPLVIKHLRQEEEQGGKLAQHDQWYWSMVSVNGTDTGAGKNIARVRNCPDSTINSNIVFFLFFFLSFWSFCLFIFLYFSFFCIFSFCLKIMLIK